MQMTAYSYGIHDEAHAIVICDNNVVNQYEFSHTSVDQVIKRYHWINILSLNWLLSIVCRLLSIDFGMINNNICSIIMIGVEDHSTSTWTEPPTNCNKIHWITQCRREMAFWLPYWPRQPQTYCNAYIVSLFFLLRLPGLDYLGLKTFQSRYTNNPMSIQIVHGCEWPLRLLFAVYAWIHSFVFVFIIPNCERIR